MGDFVSKQRRCRVVLVEDDGNLALLLRYNLDVRGYEVTCISDGSEVLAHICAEPPDAVVLDWGLPGLSGIEILRRMRTCKVLRSVPVLMLTARCLPEDRQRAMDTGASAFLAKPFSIPEVICAVQRMTRSATEMPAEPEGASL